MCGVGGGCGVRGVCGVCGECVKSVESVESVSWFNLIIHAVYGRHQRIKQIRRNMAVTYIG